MKYVQSLLEQDFKWVEINFEDTFLLSCHALISLSLVHFLKREVHLACGSSDYFCLYALLRFFQTIPFVTPSYKDIIFLSIIYHFV